MFLVLLTLTTLQSQLATSCSSRPTRPRHNPVAKTLPGPLVKQSVQRVVVSEKYPEDVVQQISQSPVLSGMFSSPLAGVESSLMSSKTSGYPRGQPVCEAITQLFTPRRERNVRGEMRWIVNQPENRTDLTQVVKITKCREGGQCHSGALSTRHRTVCKQEYMDHKLVALNVDNTQVIIDTFSFPSCCTCYIEENNYSWW